MVTFPFLFGLREALPMFVFNNSVETTRSVVEVGHDIRAHYKSLCMHLVFISYLPSI
jgi:hypothetical protein